MTMTMSLSSFMTMLLLDESEYYLKQHQKYKVFMSDRHKTFEDT